MIRLLWTEMRRGETKWIAAVLVGIGLWYFAGADAGSSDWIGWWTQTAVEVQIFAVMVMGPLTAASAAWTAGRTHRFRTLAWTETSARGAWTQAAVVWLAAMLWVLAAYALFILVACGRTAAVSDVTAPAWTPLLLGASVIGLQAAVGVAAGSLIPSRIVAPVTGIAWYASLVGIALTGADGTGFPSALLPAIDEHWDMAFRPRDGRLLTAALWCLAAGLVALALPALLRRRALRPRPYTLIPVALVAVVAAGSLLAFRAPERELVWAVHTPQPDRPVCVSSGATTACLWPEDRHLLPAARGAVKTVDRTLGPVPGLNRTFYERGLRIPDAGAQPGATGELPVMSPGIGRKKMTEDMLEASLPEPPAGCDPPLIEETGGFPGTFFFEAVVRDRVGVPSPFWGDEFAAALDRFKAVPKAGQDAWIGAAAQDIRACRPVPALPKGTAP